MRFTTSLGLIAAMLVATAAPAASAQERIKVGALRCEVSAGLGLIVTSSKDIACAFTSTRGWRERYYGKILKFGLDIGATDRGILIWDVFAPTSGRLHHALAGDYSGVGASVTVGAGLGANALLGGSERSFALQPLSLQGQTGLALAGGVESLSLRAGR